MGTGGAAAFTGTATIVFPPPVAGSFVLVSPARLDIAARWERQKAEEKSDKALGSLRSSQGCRKATSLTIVAPRSKAGTTSPGGESVHFVANANYESKPEGSPACVLTWSLDNGSLGTISPQTGSATIFKPNRIRGSGMVKVAEKISRLSDTGSITVKGGHLCIKTGELRTPPTIPTDSFKMTCTYHCPISNTSQVLFLSGLRDYPSCPPMYEP